MTDDGCLKKVKNEKEILHFVENFPGFCLLAHIIPQIVSLKPEIVNYLYLCASKNTAINSYKYGYST